MLEKSNDIMNFRKNFEAIQKANDNDEVQKYINKSFKLAISKHNIEAIKYILKCAHTLNLEQINKGELLLEAIEKTNHEIVDLLLENKFLPNDGNVHITLRTGIPYTVNILAKVVAKCGVCYRLANSTTNHQKYKTNQAFCQAQKEKEEYQKQHISLLKIIKSLLKAGANPNRIDVMHRAVTTEDLDMLKTILDSNSHKQSLNINLKDIDGGTILHKAVTCVVPEMIEYILKTNIDLQQKNRDGKTALQLAESEKNIVFDGEGRYSKECIESQEIIITLLKKAQNPKISNRMFNNPQRASVPDIHSITSKSTISTQNPIYKREQTKSDSNKTDSFKAIKEPAHKIKGSNNALMGVMLKSGFVLLCGLASISLPIITKKKEYFAVPVIIIIIAIFTFGVNLYSYFNHSNEHYKKISDVKISSITLNSKGH